MSDQEGKGRAYRVQWSGVIFLKKNIKFLPGQCDFIRICKLSLHPQTALYWGGWQKEDRKERCLALKKQDKQWCNNCGFFLVSVTLQRIMVCGEAGKTKWNNPAKKAEDVFCLASVHSKTCPKNLPYGRRARCNICRKLNSHRGDFLWQSDLGNQWKTIHPNFLLFSKCRQNIVPGWNFTLI